MVAKAEEQVFSHVLDIWWVSQSREFKTDRSKKSFSIPEEVRHSANRRSGSLADRSREVPFEEVASELSSFGAL